MLIKPTQKTAIGSNTETRLHGKFDTLVRVECNAGSNVQKYAHTFIGAYCEDSFRPSVAQRLVLGAYELLENGIKYGGIRQRVVIEILQGGEWSAVRVTNGAVEARISVLFTQLERIRSDPQGVFLEEMKRSIAGQNQRAMLGLARLAHEAHLELYAEVVDTTVSVVAHCSG